MYNIIHLASSRGMHDSAVPKRRMKVVAPAPATRLTVIDGGRAEAAPEPHPRPRPDLPPRPSAPSPSSG